MTVEQDETGLNMGPDARPVAPPQPTPGALGLRAVHRAPRPLRHQRLRQHGLRLLHDEQPDRVLSSQRRR